MRQAKRLPFSLKATAKLDNACPCAQYVVSFPKGEKYVSLLRNAEDPEAQKVLEAERKRIRAKVQQQLADIAMISQADEGLPQASHQPAQKSTSEPLQQVGTLQATCQKHQTCICIMFGGT